MKSLMRLALVALVALVAVIVAIVLWRVAARRPTTAPRDSGPQVPLALVREGTVEQTISLVGRVGSPAGTQTKLAFPLSGSIQRVDVSLGERVDAGTPLAHLDATPYALAAQQAQAEASAARAASAVASVDRTSVKLRVDEAELARQRRLYGAGVVALRDVQAAQGTVAADRAEIAGVQAQRSQAQAQSQAAMVHQQRTSYDVERTVLRAPAAGVVVGVFVQAGQVVDPTTAIVALSSDEGQGSATLDIPVAQIGRVHPGNPAMLHSGGSAWQGRVAGIAPAVDPATGLALLTVNGVPPGTPPGTPIDATVVIGTQRGLIVPRTAVIEDPQTGAHLVFVAQRHADGTLHFASRPVTVDVQDDRYARVASGLHAGERVAAQGAIDLLAPSS